MTRDDFWGLIEESRHHENQFLWIESQLSAKSLEEIVAFEDHLSAELARAHTWPFLVAAFVLNSYVSDDVFEDSKAWLISRGRERFEAAVGNPDSIADWYEPGDADHLDGEGLLLVAMGSFVEAGGDDMEFFRQRTLISPPDLETPWPDGREGVRQMLPRVVDRYWNQARINELHGDA